MNKENRRKLVEQAYAINSSGASVEPSGCMRFLMREYIEGKMSLKEVNEKILQYHDINLIPLNPINSTKPFLPKERKKGGKNNRE